MLILSAVILRLLIYSVLTIKYKSLLTVLCVNMSKNDVIYDLLIYDLRFVRTAMAKWRITDSNR